MQEVSESPFSHIKKKDFKWAGNTSLKIGYTEPVTAIFARDKKWGIGKDNDLPWSIKDFPEDMLHFRHKTVRNTVIMGRKCYESLPEPLRRRQNIILSRTLKKAPNACYLARTPEEALQIANSFGRPIFIVGGAEIYKAFEDYVGYNVVYETEVDKNFGCDVKYKFDFSKYMLLREDEHENAQGIKYYIREWMRL